MSRYMDIDEVIPLLKDIKNKSRDKNKQNWATSLLIFLHGCPGVVMNKITFCGECFFYSESNQRCCNPNGLGGELLPNHYCALGSVTDPKVIYDDKFDEDEFSAFDEVDDETAN